MPVSHAFLNELLGRLPADARASVEAAFERPEAADAISFIDNGVKRQQDYSRHLDDLRTQKEATEALRLAVQAKFEEQTAWYDAQQPLLEAGRKALKGEGVVAPAGGHVTELPPDVVRRADMEKEITAREEGVVAWSAAIQTLSNQHQHMFGEPLDVTALVADPRVRKLGLINAYREINAERLTARATAADQQRLDAYANEKVAAALAARVSNPYPVMGDNSGSPLDVLESKTPDASQFSAQAAADEYTQLAARRQATG